MSQALLKFDKAEDYSRGSFFSSSANSEALGWIEKWPEWESHCLIIYGGKGSGKTHLAHLWRDAANADFVDLNKLREVKPAEEKNVIIEDVESLKDEEALFHLYNSTKENHRYLLLTSIKPAAQLDIKLPDLRSRLNSCPNIEIKQPDDELLKKVMMKDFAERQLRVGQEVLDFIITRIERSFHCAAEMVSKVDEISMREKRAVTIPLVREILQ